MKSIVLLLVQTRWSCPRRVRIPAQHSTLASTTDDFPHAPFSCGEIRSDDVNLWRNQE
ncbi:MAG: hypothetical protein KatS3mg040_0751 [Candidatus Kapaibacterium sp.]|jgi:hypothetical protein|nr:MAG: hypothetical protein KatS3mg040_0751 [Candidatus Kapabacteria bacterium]